LISWIWIRRLIHGWPGAANLFEENPRFLGQLYHHQQWLAALPSRGSSANNHLIAEAAGQFVAAGAFPVFKDSRAWQAHAKDVLRSEAVAQTFPSGLNRELASEYQGLVLELFLAAAIEGELSGSPLGPVVWERIRAMTDASAATMDVIGHPPRQGDGDDASGLLLDAPGYNRWKALLSTGRALFGAQPWSNDTEIWCRCDHGPHGFLGIAAHAHADALAIELRVNDTEVLAEPGTYCYHGEREWRDYFRSTVGHNTLELLSQDQSVSGGPFLWTSHAQSKPIDVSGLDAGAPFATWRAEHSGYVERGGPVHQRTVTLERKNLTFTIRDQLRGGVGPFPARLAFHFGPRVKCQLASRSAKLSWPGGDAHLALSDALDWSLHRGETNPPLGWYSDSFGSKVPAFTLIGAGKVPSGSELFTELQIS
jgi:hypothetical protein